MCKAPKRYSFKDYLLRGYPMPIRLEIASLYKIIVSLESLYFAKAYNTICKMMETGAYLKYRG